MPVHKPCIVPKPLNLPLTFGIGNRNVGTPECELRVKPVKRAVVSDEFVDPADDESDNSVKDDDDDDDSQDDDGDNSSEESKIPVSNEFVSLSDLERDEVEEPQQQQQQPQQHAAPLGRPLDEDGDTLPSSLVITIPSTPSSSSAAALPTSSSDPTYSFAPAHPDSLSSHIPPSAPGLPVLSEQSDEGESTDSEIEESAALGGTGTRRRVAFDLVGDHPIVDDDATARFAIPKEIAFKETR
ncbi:hypothetical protein DL767_005307 [Monosporascus sp. MG133]|nr:hypothetical protein DL767_005307 [Monosporascus sp. MG133]